MKAKKDQHKAGVRKKPRGQQTGRAGAPDQNRIEKSETPARLGRRVQANKVSADRSEQHIAGDAVTPRSNSPATIAMSQNKAKGESGGEAGFKARLKSGRASKKRQ